MSHVNGQCVMDSLPLGDALGVKCVEWDNKGGVSLSLGVSAVELESCNYGFGKLAFFSALWNMGVV